MRNFNFEKDTRAAERLPGLKRALGELMSDPELANLQTRAEEHHKREIERLKGDPHFGALFKKISDWRPTGSFTTFKDGCKTVYDFEFPEVKNQDTSL